MRPRISQEIAQALEPHSEGRRDHRLPHDGQMIRGVVEPERETDEPFRSTVRRRCLPDATA